MTVKNDDFLCTGHPSDRPRAACSVSLSLDEYQVTAAKFDCGPRFQDTSHRASPGFSPLWYYALGLAGEAGEAVDKVKKSYRPGAPPLDAEALALELGDVLWYLSRASKSIGYTLGEVAAMNIRKLADREARGKLVGEGDKR